MPGDSKEQYLELYDRLTERGIVKQLDIGDSDMGRDIIALKVTKDAKTTDDDSRPAVLYNAVQHAREWLAGETCRRTLLYFMNNYGTDDRVTRLVDTRELWFVCVANPDGYEYTFTPGNRLWRKNMADNDGDGIRGENGDGVDPNRNFPVNWGLDNEGSSPVPASETYRGPEPYAPEPETQAMLGLFEHVDFEFQKNDHTAAELILYPQGWQQYTPTADDPIFTALAGDDKDPAINGFDPDLGAELYITNGDTNDTAYNREGILSYTPEGTVAKDPTVSGFEYADSEGAIQAEFQRHRNFSIDLAESAGDPDDPVNHLKNTVRTSTSTRSSSPSAIRSRCRCWRRGPWASSSALPDQRLPPTCGRCRPRNGPTASGTTQEEGVYYHRVRGSGGGHQRGRRGRGVVRPGGRQQAFAVVHLHGGGRDRQPGARARRGGLQRPDAGAGPERPALRR